MRTEDLIADLARRAGPVRPLASPARRLAGWSVVAAASAFAGFAAFGPRDHVTELVGRAPFAAMTLVSLGTAALAALAALVLSVPGAKRGGALKGAALTLLTVWGALLVAAVLRAGTGFPGEPHWPICAIRVVAIGLVPAWTLLVMLRRAAPLQPASAGAFAAVAAMAVSAAAIQYICPIDAPAHVLRGHFAPVIILAIASALIARRALTSSR